MLGTPAEEAYGGKIDLIEAGAFEGAAAAMMIHPSPEDVLDPSFLAVAHLDIDFFGKESHAAFAPQVGINALDAAVQAYVNISTLRQTLYNTDKVHGVITYGGGAPNVIPAHTSLAFYVRAASMERLAELRTKVEACFEAAAMATGCSVEIKPRGHTYTEMHNDPVMVDLFAANSGALGRTDGPRGAHSIRERRARPTWQTSAAIVPTIHPMLGINSAPAVNHQTRVRRPHHHTGRREGHPRRSHRHGMDRRRRGERRVEWERASGGARPPLSRGYISRSLYWSRTTFLSNLPVPVLGISSMKRIRSGSHHLATRPSRNSRQLLLGRPPCRQRAPRRRWGAPAT